MQGGNIIKYLMITRKLLYKKALDYFKYTILKQPTSKNIFVDIIQQQVNDVGLNIKINDVTWIQQHNSKNGGYYKILCPILEKYIKTNVPFIFVRSGTKSGILKYFYIDNYYKLVSDTELKGVIKAFIPSKLQKMKDITEVFSLLETDVKFKPIDKISNTTFIINFNNGLLDLKTGKLKPHSPKYLCTIRIPCNYIENAPIPPTKYFDNFINDLTNGNEDVKALILQIVGVVISNVPRL